MSVPKSRRGESPAEYINLAREIYVFTYNRVRLLTKTYTFYFSLPLYNAAREAYRLVKTANLIYIDSKQDGPIAERNKQRRRELYENAQGYYNSIVKLSRGFTFLKVRFRYGPQGKVIRRVSYQSVKHMRDKLKIFRRWVDSGRMGREDVKTSLTSWRGHMRRFNSYFLVQTVEKQYRELFAA